MPFHLRYLWAGMMPFHAYLSKKINLPHLNPDMLVGRYIPNLIVKSFDISKEYVQIIYGQTSSPCLGKVLKEWDQENWASAEQHQKLAIILVELLAYHFAFPLCLSPTIMGIAMRTLKAKYETSNGSVSWTRIILCAKNMKFECLLQTMDIFSHANFQFNFPTLEFNESHQL
ncbi:hypothetical protein C0995_013717 [Termitomyces sp. Mi166|nr:hypothetical protein C0995_013717 [Termitomyces sp. Mi166\